MQWVVLILTPLDPPSTLNEAVTRPGSAPKPGLPPRTRLSLVTGDGDEPTAALVEQAKAAERAGRRDEARVLYEKALHSRIDPPDAALATSLFRWIGSTYRVDANHEAALDCIEVALAVAELAANHGAIGHATNLRAIVRWQLGDLDAAEREYNEARASALRAGDARLAAMIGQNLGVIANIRGDLDVALRYYEASLASYRSLGLANDVCVALNNLGKLHTDTARWADAHRAYSEALQISGAIGDLPSQILLHVNVAELYVAQSLYDEARDECDRATDLTRRTEDDSALGEIHRLYGIVARETGRLTDAEQRFLAAEQIAVERQETLLRAQTARELALVYRELGRNRETLQCLNRSHALFSQLRARRDLADIASRMTSLEGEFLEVVRRWGESIESKDRYTQGHCVRVADLACALAMRTGMDKQTLFWFRIGALLHDVGKLVIPEEVLNKPGRLTEDEWALMRRHPTAGVEMVSEIVFPWDIRPIIEQHHECWDGSGYPNGLSGEQIAFTARILAIADVYDALTSERSYKKALAHEDAMTIMRRDVGRQFDPALFRAFDELVQDSDDPALARLLTPRVIAPQPAPQPPGGAPDELTGLPLRRAFFHRAESALATRYGSNADVSLLVLDVDRFKLVNDTFGHLQGDDVMRSVATTLKASLRTNDLLARYAGDEFVILLPQTSCAVAAETAERLRRAVERCQVPVREGAGGISVTVSIGVATAPNHGEAVETLFAAADRALYDAKAAGRNRVGVASDSAPAATPDLRLERFVGRTEELRSLVRHLDAATHADPRVVAVIGEAGIGKTALVRELEPDARLRSGLLVLGRCFEADVKPPYGAWADVIQSIHALGIAPDRDWRELSRIVPALGRRDTDTESALGKYAIFDEITQFLTMAAAARPLVVLLDDMQWADSATWDVLEHLLAHLGQERILLCLTIRTEDIANVGARLRRLSRDDRFHELRVARLSMPDLRRWMEAVFHQGDLSNELPEFVDRYAEGNPLLIMHVLRSLADDGAVWYAGTRWEWRPVAEFRLPAGARDLLARRLERLSPRARQILGATAVLGRTFEVDIALEAAGCSEDDLLDAIDEGVAAHVIASAVGPSNDCYAFTHGLLADAARAALNPRRLRRTHERIAQALTRRNPDAHAEIAAHYAAADCAADAFRYATLGARRAKELYAGEEARSFIELALRCAAAPAQRLEAHTLAAHLAETMGRYADAEAHCVEILGNDDSVVSAHERLAIERLHARLRALQGTPPRDTIRTCSDLLERAERAGNAAERVHLLNMLAVARGRLGDSAVAQQLASESVAVARDLGDERLHADALLRLGSALLESGSAQALSEYHRALEIYVRLDDRYGQVRCRINIGIAYSRAGDRGAAEESYHAAIALGRSASAPDLCGLATLNLGVLHSQRGECAPAATCFTEAFALFTTVKNEVHCLAAQYNQARLELESQRPQAALSLFNASIALAVQVGAEDVEIGARAGAGLSSLALGDVSEAVRLLAASSLPLTTRGDWWFQGRELVEALAVRTSLTAGDVSTAAARFSTSVERAHQFDPFAAAWLVAECGLELSRYAAAEVAEAAARVAPTAVRLRNGKVAEQCTALLERGHRGEQSSVQ